MTIQLLALAFLVCHLDAVHDIQGAIMPKSFLMFASESIPAANPTANPADMPIEPPASDRESLRILIIGSRRGVTGTIQTLHRLRFAEVREWSPLLPAPNSGEVMSILTRYVMPE